MEEAVEHSTAVCGARSARSAKVMTRVTPRTLRPSRVPTSTSVSIEVVTGTASMISPA